jgi:Cse1
VREKERERRERQERDREKKRKKLTHMHRRDAEGSDTDTRRRAALELVKGLRKHYEARVTQLFSSDIPLSPPLLCLSPPSPPLLCLSPPSLSPASPLPLPHSVNHDHLPLPTHHPNARLRQLDRQGHCHLPSHRACRQIRHRRGRHHVGQRVGSSSRLLPGSDPS